MQQALDLAQQAGKKGAVPVGALLVDSSGRVLCTSKNTLEDPTSHAEVNVIREYFSKLRSENEHKSIQVPDDLTLITTLEPCIMCAGAIMNAHISRVVFGAWDEKFGASGSVWDLIRDPRAPYRTEVYGGVEAKKCSKVLKEFFQELRARKHPQIHRASK